MARTYDALLTFGKAVNEETLTLPNDVYRCLDQTAALYEESARAGCAPLVIVSGLQRARRVYRNNLLRGKDGLPLRECDPMAEYLLERYGIEATREGKAGSVGDKLARSTLILMEKTEEAEEPAAIRQACIVTLEPLQPRIQALAHKIFGSFCGIDVDTVRTTTKFPLENKYFGDHLCMLKNVANGDHNAIINPADDTSQWPRLGAEHNETTCQYYLTDPESEPFTNNHPAHVMQELLADSRRP